MDSAIRESTLWRWLTSAQPQFGQRLHMCRIENRLSASAADVEGCLDGFGFWIELKCAARPAKLLTPIRLRFERGQTAWLNRRREAGGASWVLIQVGSGADARRYLVPGDLAPDLEHQPRPEVRLTDFSMIVPTASAADVLLTAVGLIFSVPVD